MNLFINRNSQESLTKQIYKGIMSLIFNGSLKANSKLPSTRMLAENLSVSRTIVIDAYDQLYAEGFVYTLDGSGTFVSEGINYDYEIHEPSVYQEEKVYLYDREKGVVSFRTGLPDLSLVPIELWGRLYRKATVDMKKEELDYHNPMGYFPLRATIASYLGRLRGVYASPNNILITSGAAQGLSLLRNFLSHGDYILVENPVSMGIVSTLLQQNVDTRSIEVDEYGIRTDLLPDKPPKLIITTPSHQFPSGGVLTIKRRLELLRYANEHDCYIVEDDYDSEFRYEGEPVQAMQGLDPSRVIYLGTYSKTFCPAVRMGYMIVPPRLIGLIEDAKYNTDIHSPLIEQMAMQMFISEGDFEKHLKKMRKVYKKKRDVLVKSLKESFKDRLTIQGSETGLHLIAKIQCQGQLKFSKLESKKFKDYGIEIVLIEDCLFPKQRNDVSKRDDSLNLVLGFGNLSIEEIKIGIQRLSLCFVELP